MRNCEQFRTVYSARTMPRVLVLVVVHRSIGVHNIRLMFEQLRIVAVDLIHTEYCMVHQ